MGVFENCNFPGPPYPPAKDLDAAFRAETPPELAYLDDDLFETITLYDNRAKSASMKDEGGAWKVTMKYVAKKQRADEKGDAKDVGFDDLIDVGALDEKGNAIFVEKRRIKSGEGELTFTSPKRPVKVGIDPLNKLIDRDSGDNVTAPSTD
jgi:hypothetical protein